jgi:hypothetical protein
VRFGASPLAAERIAALFQPLVEVEIAKNEDGHGVISRTECCVSRWVEAVRHRVTVMLQGRSGNSKGIRSWLC